MGPSTEQPPYKTSPQNTIQRPDWLNFITVLRLSHQENPASCSSNKVVIQENVVHLCLFPGHATSRLHQGFGNTKSGDEKIFKGCDVNQRHGSWDKPLVRSWASLWGGVSSLGKSQDTTSVCTQIFPDSSFFPGGLRYKQETGSCFLLCLFW